MAAAAASAASGVGAAAAAAPAAGEAGPASAHFYVSTAQRSTVVTHAVTCHFTGLQPNLVVAQSTHLQVFTVTADGLEPVADLPLYGRVAVLDTFRPKVRSGCAPRAGGRAGGQRARRKADPQVGALLPVCCEARGRRRPSRRRGAQPSLLLRPPALLLPPAWLACTLALRLGTCSVDVLCPSVLFGPPLTAPCIPPAPRRAGRGSGPALCLDRGVPVLCAWIQRGDEAV